MDSNNKHIGFKICLSILSILVVVFIFKNSMTVGVASQAISDGIVAKLARIFQAFGLDYETSSYITRKMGHVLEFALLGFVLCANTLLYSKKFSHIAWPLLLGLLTALCDEFIQGFVPGRSSQVSDVFIDFIGLFGGVIFMYLLYLIFSAPKRRRYRNSYTL